jgi:hypothetical protein
MNDDQIVEELKKRFFWTRTQGGQKYFVDMQTGENDLSVGHLHYVLVSLWDVGIEQRKKVLDGIDMKLKPLTKGKVYRPKLERVLCREGLYFENTWVDDGASPSDDSAAPFEEHLMLALKDQFKVDYLLDLLAYKYQNPYKPKPHAVVYFYHAEGGNGKSVFAETLETVFGSSAVTIASEKKMNSGSKVMLWAKTLLIAEEADVGRGSDIYDTIKTYSGQGTIDDDTKHQHFKKYDIPANLFMMSNRAPTFVEPNDRRFFIAEWKLDMEAEAKASYFTSYIKWLKEEGGFEAIAGLFSRREVTRDMYAPVPMTEEKKSAMSLAQDECVQEIVDFLDDNQDSRVFRQSHFKEIFDNHLVKPNQRKHKLLEAGLKRHHSRVQVGGEKITPWIRQNDRIEGVKGKGTTVSYEGKISPIEGVLHPFFEIL